MHTVDRDAGCVWLTTGKDKHSGLTADEILLIRTRINKGDDPEVVSFELNMDYNVVLKVMDGTYGPLIGGALSVKPSGGLVPANAKTSEQKAFVSAVVRLAMERLDPEQFEVVANQNGFTVPKFKGFVAKESKDAKRKLALQRQTLVSG